MASIAERVAQRGARLTAAERRVAEMVASSPEVVAFGTVASVAEAAGTSGPTVVRAASKLGFAGFVGLQAAVQEELAERLRPASERMRTATRGDPLARAVDMEIENVRATLRGAPPATFATAIERLARARAVRLLSGEASAGVAAVFADQLALLRDGVELVGGSAVRVMARAANVGRQDTVVAIDLRRYDADILRATRLAASAGAWIVALTDGLLSPLAEAAHAAFVVSAHSAGPFDSHVGTLALSNALASGVASALRRSATARLDRAEESWRTTGALVER
jgi:DNA-binding MurR/RpiR family transcriptional regulator